MARTTTVRVIAAIASVPLAAALFTGVAQADNGAFADDGSNSAATSQGIKAGSGVSNNTQQVANGYGNSNSSQSANVVGNDGFAWVMQFD